MVFEKGHPAYGGFKTRFKKGHIPWCKGKELSKEIKLKISISKTKLKNNKCEICNIIYKPFYQNQKLCSSKCKGVYLSKINKGKKLSEKHKQKIRETLTGRKNPEHSKRMKGRKQSEETKEKRRNALKGEKCYLWIDGRSYNKSPKRYGDDWNNIRYLVYKRDNFTCQRCKVKGIKLDIHHKIPFMKSKDNSLNNLISLCRSCHMKEERKICV